MPKRFLLSAIYFSRSLAILVFILLPPSPAATLIFGAVMGLLWLSTIPPTSALVAIMFGNRWLTMLLGLAFFSHQVGGFLGVWLGGVLFERTGSYDVIWWGTIFFGVASAIINLPIVEKPVPRPRGGGGLSGLAPASRRLRASKCRQADDDGGRPWRSSRRSWSRRPTRARPSA